MVCSLSPAAGLDLARESRDWRNRPLTALDAVGTSYKDGNTLLDSGASVAKMAEAIESMAGLRLLPSISPWSFGCRPGKRILRQGTRRATGSLRNGCNLTVMTV